MKKETRNRLVLLGIHIIVWAIVLFLPAFMVNLIKPELQVKYMFGSVAVRILPIMVTYFINFFLFVPLLLLKKKRVWLFVLVNILWILLSNSGMFFLTPGGEHNFNPFIAVSIYSSVFVNAFIHVLTILCAVGIRFIIRNYEIENQLAEQQKRSTEAELVWLKNQLNPHFLFNTLNNISSLTQLDPDRAQDSIGQLSDLLRYALYETQSEKTALSGEIEFMRNYIALMQLRCNEKTTVTCDFSVRDKDIMVPPLLYISFVENAFKHGVSASQESLVEFTMKQTEKGKLLFTSRNTNHQKGASDHSGSGIGLENTRRRLDLIYKDRYTWQQEETAEFFTVSVEIEYLS